ncbi:hypothetical protein DYB32_007707 [Aphanomyces invadans]|uniref:Uncharacterized protein n=1 Tax=Aphanomyces invadans TaxID=157072 RepID=A0A418AN17_9STRA|nr:hypothetical protein DYB32_007707 [Aphanomyces invadans]
MLCEPVLTLVEKHTKFFRALFLSPSLKKRTTTGAMLRHLVMSKTDFLDMAKAANIFPTVLCLLSMEDVLTFPEFIECLFRCSERFFTVGNDDDGGEVRFQALVMAMDGYGSILQVMMDGNLHGASGLFHDPSLPVQKHSAHVERNPRLQRAVPTRLFWYVLGM